MSELRRRLKAADVRVYDELSQYSTHLCKLFGLRSQKALHLLNQVVSIKEIGGLNDFVRTHVLDTSDAQEKMRDLRENYQNLTCVHAAIQRAKQQRDALRPIVREGATHRELQARIEEADGCAKLVPVALARHTLWLLAQATATAEARLAQAQDQSKLLCVCLHELRQQERTLYAAIASDAAGQRLQQLRREIEHLAERRDTRYAQAEQYEALTHPLNLPGYRDEATFYETRAQAAHPLPEVEAHLEALDAECIQHSQCADQLEESCRVLRNELDSLRRRTSQIPTEDLAMRAWMAVALGIAEDALPFIGGLLKVRKEAIHWEGAIERLLHSYGLQLLVPVTHYQQVSRYVNGTNLRELTFVEEEL